MSGKCAKCKTCPREGSDSWCLGCSSWESIGRDLCARWDGPAGIRQIANSLAVNCAREIRALRGLGAGLHLAPGPKAGTKVKEEPIEQRPLAKGPPPGLSAKAKAAPAEESEYSFEEEEESEEEGATLASAVDPRPSLPRSRVPRTDASPVGAGLPSGAGESRAPVPADFNRAGGVKGERRSEDRSRERSRRRGGDRRRDHSRDHHKEKKSRKEKEDRKEHKQSGDKRRKRKRGGRKHQRLARLATDPHLDHHRKLSDDFLRRRDQLPRDPLP